MGTELTMETVKTKTDNNSMKSILGTDHPILFNSVYLGFLVCTRDGYL